VIARAQQVAADMKAEAAKPQPEVGKVKQLVLSAMGARMNTLGQAAVTELVHLASQPLQVLT
jgi:hypothetical protein